MIHNIRFLQYLLFLLWDVSEVFLNGCELLMILNSVNLDHKQAMKNQIIIEYKDVFSSELPYGLPPSRSVDHIIKISPRSQSIFRQPYRFSRKEEMEISNPISEDETYSTQ